MSCKYCEYKIDNEYIFYTKAKPRFELQTNENDLVKVSLVKRGILDMALFINECYEDANFFMGITLGGDDFLEVQRTINFCPMCGRKLQKGVPEYDD